MERSTRPRSPQKTPNHSRTPSIGDYLRGRKNKEADTPRKTAAKSRERPLSERPLNSPPQAKRVPLKGEDNGQPALHKRTKSSVSLKGLMREKEKKPETTNNVNKKQVEVDDDSKLKRPKSSTSLAALLQSKGKSPKKSQDTKNLNKENTTPPSSAGATGIVRSPIWEQFATQPFEDQFGKVYSPERKERIIRADTDPFLPKSHSEYFPSQLQDFYGAVPDPIDERPPQRPYLEHRSSRSSIFKEEGLDDESPICSPLPQSIDPSTRPKSAKTSEERPRLGKTTSNTSQASDMTQKRSSKVISAINTLSFRSKDLPSTPVQPPSKQPLSPAEIDTEFETMLDAQNIPHNIRDKMRSLDMTIKADLVKKNRVGSGSSSVSGSGNPDAVRSSARSPTKTDNSRPMTRDGEKETKESRRSRSRPRSRTFTLSKGGSSPTKKSKSEDSNSNGRPKSMEISGSRPGSSRSLKSSNSSTSLSSLARREAASPTEFIHYLREVQKPELVEVGKMHKLRILLRNESVSWTDTFISKGGFDEIVALLYRIMAVEWREEHEDNLLHESLLCLKALCTTTLALQRLVVIQDTIFPALLHMLFDEEKKGPSEFATRNIVMSLLFMHLSDTVQSPESTRVARAQKILSFLRDPAPEDDKQPLGFIQQMHSPRPYRVWCKEIVNVTKEVFWIFLHHLNVIPVATQDSASASESYIAAHFPAPRPPHPAAPYVGGVEWEATTYLATHLDLLNGLIASLPTVGSRNALREELKVSGFEKCMGGSLRTCKEKFYGHVHEGLKCWVSAGKADGWEVESVRAGPPREEKRSSPAKSPVKGGKKNCGGGAAPKLDLALDLGVGDAGKEKLERFDAWI
ncbi:MAG: hypothetical protein Q9227_000982 [Pyrenula ochraceoflavens]